MTDPVKRLVGPLLDEYEESFINGNVSWVIEQIHKMPKARATYVTAELMRRFRHTRACTCGHDIVDTTVQQMFLAALEEGFVMAYPLDVADAMVVAIVATEAFLSVDMDALPKDVKRGVLLLFEAQMRRVKPLLPQTDDMQHVRAAICLCEKVGDAVRERYTLPPEGVMTQSEALALLTSICGPLGDVFDRCTGSAETCPIDECELCSVRDCPAHEPLHYHHDGCPSCATTEVNS